MLYYIKGPPKSGKTFMANALRNQAGVTKRPTLLLDEDQEGEPQHLLGKLVLGAGVALTPEGKVDLERTRWKGARYGGDGKRAGWDKEPVVVAVGDRGEALLAAVEALAPGLTAMVGPGAVLALEARK